MLKLVVFFCLVAVVFGAATHDFRPRLDERIIGGTDAPIEEFPYQVSVQFFNGHLCGGVIISENWVLTAGQCIFSDPYAYTIRAGSSIRSSGGTYHSVSTLVRHPDYASYTTSYDFALVQITDTFYGEHEASLALAIQGEEVAVGTEAIVTGWGQTSITEPSNTTFPLQQVTVPIVDQTICNTTYDGEIDDSMMCAGLLGVGGKDACLGDAGGPLVTDGKIIGIMSWSYGCASPEYPSVYARVASVRDWISTVTGV